MKMIKADDVAFKPDVHENVMIFIKGEHAGVIEVTERWGRVKLFKSPLYARNRDHLVFMANKEEMRQKVAKLYNEFVSFFEPFERIKSISRVTRKEINACIVKIVENEGKLSKDQMVELIKGIVL